MQLYPLARRLVNSLRSSEGLFLWYVALTCAFFLHASAGVSLPGSGMLSSIILLPWFLLIFPSAMAWHAMSAAQSIAALCGVTLLLYLWWRWQPQAVRDAGRLLLICALMFGSTAALCHLSVPRRVAFWFSRTSFEAALERIDEKAPEHSTQVGLYSVNSWTEDPRGGTYFGLRNPDPLFGNSSKPSGFVFWPNHVGTPWGDDGLELTRMSGEWFFFSVQDR